VAAEEPGASGSGAQGSSVPGSGTRKQRAGRQPIIGWRPCAGPGGSRWAADVPGYQGEFLL